MRKIYFDLLSGASGDMLLASMIDLGVPPEYLNEQFARMPVEHIHLKVEKVERSGIQCTYINPEWEHAHNYRHIHDIIDIIKAGNFNASVLENSIKVLDILAGAESEVHGISKDKVHFHEIGAVDTILDIVGFCLCLDYLGIQEVEFSTLTDGHGVVKTEHGQMPVPVPATSKLIQGYELKILDIGTELLTPTGAALLTALGRQVQFMSGNVKKVGFSCGTKKFEMHPNILRSFIIEDNGLKTNDEVLVIESDMDHISGEVMGYVGGLLLEHGAFDVTWIPVYMKKGRPAYRLSVLCSDNNAQKLIDLIILQTRTLGVRIQRSKRIITEREQVSVKFQGQQVREKRCKYKGYTFSKLEYESLVSLSRERSIPIIELIERYIIEKENGKQDTAD